MQTMTRDATTLKSDQTLNQPQRFENLTRPIEKMRKISGKKLKIWWKFICRLQRWLLSVYLSGYGGIVQSLSFMVGWRLCTCVDEKLMTFSKASIQLQKGVRNTKKTRTQRIHTGWKLKDAVEWHRASMCVNVSEYTFECVTFFYLPVKWLVRTNYCINCPLAKSLLHNRFWRKTTTKRRTRQQLGDHNFPSSFRDSGWCAFGRVLVLVGILCSLVCC